MRVFVAGATGAIGRRLVPLLAAAGHEVSGMTRSEGRSAELRALGATPVVADALDPDAVAAAVAAANPEAIVHELTALSGAFESPRRPERSFAGTDRLRTEATDHLLAAGRAVGVRRFLAQSFAGWPYAPEGGPAKTEEAPLDPDPPRQLARTHAAIRHLEEAVTGAGGPRGSSSATASSNGPGTGFAPGGEQFEMVRKRAWPVIGDGGGIWTFVHVEDAASATAAALERGAPGIYNVCDDDPAPVAECLPGLAAAIGAKPPRRVPRWLGRLAGGEAAAYMSTEIRGADNAKLKRELGWEPRYPSWRRGFAEALG